MADSAADVEAREGSGSSSAAQTAKDLFSGAAGGIAQVLIGMSGQSTTSPFGLLSHN
jgi:solute carrier family 25 carnitine/acylcarnitine transporter 20/29